MRDTERQGNIELLRILAILGVIVLHYNNGEIGGGFVYAHGVNKIILVGLENLFICSVNLFMLISGYFLCIQENRKPMRVIELLTQVILFQLGFYLLNIWMGRTVLSVGGILKSLVPNNYFVILYIVTYLISPYFNLLLKKLGGEKCRGFIILLLILFSVWPTFVDLLQEITSTEFAGLSSIGLRGSQYGYTIVNFLLLYCVGAYLRLYRSKEYKCSVLVSGLVLTIGLLSGWCMIEQIIWGGISGSVWAYCNPIVIMEAVIIFLLFEKVLLKNARFVRIINRLAKGGFTTYLLHAPLLSFVRISWAVQRNCLVMVLHILVSVAGIYMICFICYLIWNIIMGPIFSWLSSRKWIIYSK